jgi:hypothetical protein
LDKKLFHNIHPALPRFMGLKQSFFDLQDCRTAKEAQITVQAAAAAPPFMSGVLLQSGWAFDGGYTDNAPIPAQTAGEKASSLVLPTRHCPTNRHSLRCMDATTGNPAARCACPHGIAARALR